MDLEKSVIHGSKTTYLVESNIHMYFLGHSCSSSADMTCGVPQGSILGPISFLLLINDLPNASKELFSILFADDTTLQISGSNLEELYSNANCELDKAYDCFCNKLTLNVSKNIYFLELRKK